MRSLTRRMRFWSRHAATGYCGASAATGNYGASSATGDSGVSSVTGKCSVSSVTGFNGASEARNKESIAVAWGYKSKARGVIGSYLVFADWEGDERNFSNPDVWELKGAKMVRVDGEEIKENVWYCIKNGVVVECD